MSADLQRLVTMSKRRRNGIFRGCTYLLMVILMPLLVACSNSGNCPKGTEWSGFSCVRDWPRDATGVKQTVPDWPRVLLVLKARQTKRWIRDQRHGYY
jgi:hypothetical protein